ncbi:nucleoside recognition domain-containing protein [Botrimarina hoheduenensis]|uniref:Spore maturation protein A n=1 Tax=Botrimarina hoheduenensis TaxID=2528000 RepID=A0A5C5WD28_9BACT|nr:nucleoside recognition domain-containing protein [Botrimarina hoheduenensis]TWT48826.1 Spore maturation protein A [Botrimarina hoheduenensis]
MLNRIWFWLLVIGVCYAPVKSVVAPLMGVEITAFDRDTGQAIPPPTIADMGQEVTTAAIEGAESAVSLCLNLIGPMVLWLGVMQIAKDAGLVDGLAWLMRPLMRWLFPEVPDGHPAQGAILMNLSANMLNLANAATPFGLKAMKELQTLNTTEETATNSMATFLAINTSSVTIIPFTIVGLRSAAGSEDPAAPLFGIFLATLCSTCVAIFAVRTLAKLPAFAATAPEPLSVSVKELA